MSSIVTHPDVSPIGSSTGTVWSRNGSKVGGRTPLTSPKMFKKTTKNTSTCMKSPYYTTCVEYRTNILRKNIQLNVFTSVSVELSFIQLDY